MPTVSTQKMTARQFLHIGEDPPGVTLELVNGEVAVSPSPKPPHSRIDTKLRIILGTHIEENGLGDLLGDVDTIFGEHDVRRPDLVYFRTDRMHLVTDDGIEGPPDLCIEILSPKSRQIDRVDKFRQYAAGKVRHYWIVDPKAKTVEAFELVRGKYRLAAGGKGNETVTLPPFPDLSIDLARVWRKPGGSRSR